MGASIKLYISKEDQSMQGIKDYYEQMETINEYYDRYFESVQKYLDVGSVDQTTNYQSTVEILKQNGEIWISHPVPSSISEVMDPTITEIWNQYGRGELNEDLTSTIGLAAFVRECEKARERIGSVDLSYVGSDEFADEDALHKRRLGEYSTLADFAIENGYGLRHVY